MSAEIAMACGHTEAAYYDGCQMCAELEEMRESIKAKDAAIGLFLHHWKCGGISRRGFFAQQTAALMMAATPKPEPAREEKP